jgi:hypothetical protein
MTAAGDLSKGFPGFAPAFQQIKSRLFRCVFLFRVRFKLHQKLHNPGITAGNRQIQRGRGSSEVCRRPK